MPGRPGSRAVGRGECRPRTNSSGRHTLHTTQGVKDYLCNRMYSLDERLLEAHLGQLVTLAVTQPSPSLERLLGDLCRRSPRVACKVRHTPAPRRGGASGRGKQEPLSRVCCGAPGAWR